MYEPEDYEEAIGLVASGALPLEKLITAVQPLEELPEAFMLFQKKNGNKNWNRIAVSTGV